MDINNNYEMYKYFVKTYIKRDGVDNFLEWLDTTDAIEAPCSTKYHLSCKGGLIQHNLNVFSRLIKFLKDEYGDNCPYNQEQIAIVALLHDLSKINNYVFGTKNIKNDVTGQWEKQDCIFTKDENDRFFYGTHSETSLYIAKRFFNLTYDEEIAILYHMGGLDYSEAEVSRNVYTAFRKVPLAYYLHLADFTATIMDEANDGNIEKGA